MSVFAELELRSSQASSRGRRPKKHQINGVLLNGADAAVVVTLAGRLDILVIDVLFHVRRSSSLASGVRSTVNSEISTSKNAKSSRTGGVQHCVNARFGRSDGVENVTDLRHCCLRVHIQNPDKGTIVDSSVAQSDDLPAKVSAVIEILLVRMLADSSANSNVGKQHNRLTHCGGIRDEIQAGAKILILVSKGLFGLHPVHSGGHRLLERLLRDRCTTASRTTLPGTLLRHLVQGMLHFLHLRFRHDAPFLLKKI